MVKHKHEPNAGTGKRIVRHLILIKADSFGIPESLKVDYPVVVGSLPRDQTIPLSIRPIIVENTGQAVDETEGV